VDTIEIEPAMVEAARLFLPRNARAYQDPRSRIHIEDAKTFFAARGERYDIIVSEPSNPWVSGVSTLFSEEFYAQVKRSLRDDGVLVQWIHAYELDLTLLASIFNALGKHFPDYAVYSWNPGDLYVVATPRAALPRPDGRDLRASRCRRRPPASRHRDLTDLLTLRLAGRATLEPLFAATGAPANSDYFPVLDQRAPALALPRRPRLRTARDARCARTGAGDARRGGAHPGEPARPDRPDPAASPPARHSGG
jgi:hypothetical protein